LLLPPLLLISLLLVPLLLVPLLLLLLLLLLVPPLLPPLLPPLPAKGGAGAADAAGDARGGGSSGGGGTTSPHFVAARVQVALCFHITASNAAVGTKGGGRAAAAAAAAAAGLAEGGAAAWGGSAPAMARDPEENLGPLPPPWRSTGGAVRRWDVFRAERGACKPLLSLSTFETEEEALGSADAIVAAWNRRSTKRAVQSQQHGGLVGVCWRRRL
jgi:hypothetical protein